MRYGFVSIAGQDGDQVFIDSSPDSAGAAPGPFRVPFGQHKFETRGDHHRVRLVAVNTKTLTVTLEPVT